MTAELITWAVLLGFGTALLVTMPVVLVGFGYRLLHLFK